MLSGDIAFSGGAEEYNEAEKFVGELQASILGKVKIDKEKKSRCFLCQEIMIGNTLKIDLIGKIMNLFFLEGKTKNSRHILIESSLCKRIGLPLSKSLYDFLIAGHFPSAVWQFPIISLGVILLFVSIAAIAAVYAPAKRIRNMSITATINEL